MAEKRLRSGLDWGNTIGNNGKQALKDYIEDIRDKIKPYTKSEGWAHSLAYLRAEGGREPGRTVQ